MGSGRLANTRGPRADRVVPIFFILVDFIEYSLTLMAEVLNGLMGCHYRLWQGQHRQLWLAVVVSCLSGWQIAHNHY